MKIKTKFQKYLAPKLRELLKEREVKVMDYFDIDKELARLKSRPIKYATIDRNNECFIIEFKDGGRASYGTQADCCSHSWIEHFESPNDLEGAEITEILELEEDDVSNKYDMESETERCGADCLAIYQTIFRTTKGDIVLEYRNDSNGNYGGSLIVEE